jgi:hypothetical protein
MTDLSTYARDVRHRDPNKNGIRKSHFKRSFKRGLYGPDLADSTLRTLTWGNIAYRIARPLRELHWQVRDETIDKLWDLCVAEQANQNRRARSATNER